jgi:hypothetical protein
MNRNNATLYLALIFYFSCLQTGVFGLTADPVIAKSDASGNQSVFEQPLGSLEIKTVLNIPDNKVSSLFGTKENPVMQTIPLSDRTFAWFWDNWFKDDDFEEPLEPIAVEPSRKNTTSETPEKKIIEKKGDVAEELPWWKPEAYEIVEDDTPSEVVPENKIRVVPPVFRGEPIVKEKPEQQMEKAVPESLPVVKPETVEVPKPTIVPEVVPEKKILAVPEVAPVQKPIVKEKPEWQMKKAVPESLPVVKPETVEVPKPTIVPEVVPEKKILAIPQVAPVQKPAEKAKPEIQQKEAVAETKVTSPGFFKGAKACEECHEGEFKIWKKTKHHTSFRTVHREPKDSAKPSPKKILANVAGAKRMKRNKTCYLCHYTLQQKTADTKPVAKSGTSCESCHGASSEYLAIHDNYGGEGVKRTDETPGHRKKRIEMSTAKGLIWPEMKYQVVENCMTCHGLAHPGLSGDVLAKMLGAGHPINPEFEAVKYSQGTVRHRYTPENITNNREMTEPERAELFVIGHAAALVSAKEAISKSNETKYTDAQKKRAKNAQAVLSLLTDIPEAQQLMASPNRSNALKLVNALTGKDLTGKVGSMLPTQSDYK